MVSNRLTILISIIALSACTSAEDAEKKSADKPPAVHNQASVKNSGEEEIRSLIAGTGNLITYSRLSGLINDILREQKRLFMERHINEMNTVSMDAEETVNEAALYASERNFKDSFKKLEKAYDMLAVSIADLPPAEK